MMSILELPSKLAKLVIHSSLEVKKGQMVAIQGSTEATPLIKELYREILRAGAYPEVVMQLPDQEYIHASEASDEILARESSVERHIIEHCDALILIQSDPNPFETSRVPASKLNLRRMGKAGVFMSFMQRVDTPSFRFMSMPWPTQGQAVISRMSLEELSGRLESACFLDYPDPQGEWERQRATQQKLINRLLQVKNLRIRTLDTDLELSVDGRNWLNCYGRQDLPDGEVFTAPLENSVNGTVKFSYPARKASGIQLTFKYGEVVSAKADTGDDYLQQTLLTPGARRLGEIGIGTNFNITDPIGQILFDEKIGGTVHLALGSAYPASGGTNQSPLHWDLIIDLRQDGELLGDGQAILKGGQFVYDK
jgi:aminopeptidase